MGQHGHTTTTMETASYLHKKFKKQLSVVESTPTTAAAPIQSTNERSSSQQPEQQQQQQSSISSSSAAAAAAASCNDDISSSWAGAPVAATTTTTSSSEQGAAARGAATGKYVCLYCNLVCSKPSVLQKHIRAHTNERPYPCNSCGFSFKTRSNLYKHCRSRTHANRVMGTRPPDDAEQLHSDNLQPISKPYKPRFHTAKQFFKENNDRSSLSPEENTSPNASPSPSSTFLSDHINDIINKNNSIVNDGSALCPRRRGSGESESGGGDGDEPLNLTKQRKRCLSEMVVEGTQKSLIKELLLKNLSSDMQCPHCKMIFQTVTELELHKLRSCKGFVKPGAKYSRSSSVNVASILTQNKNAFDSMPHIQNVVFPLKSPGPFLGKTRLVESDKSKSFSFDDTHFVNSQELRFRLSPHMFEKEKRPPVKMFGGEVKIASVNETKNCGDSERGGEGGREYDAIKMSENRVVKSSLQSGGTVLTNKASYTKDETFRVYETSPISPKIDLPHLGIRNIADFSLKAVKMLTPNLKQPSIAALQQDEPQNLKVAPPSPCNPVKLMVNGKVVRYVPGMPGPLVTEEPMDMAPRLKPPPPAPPQEPPNPPPKPLTEPKKFARPNSLALKPTTASLKQHHGLTPTMFNQILISPDTPRVAKKYVQQYLHGNYFSYLGLKSSTKPVYCTLNKTQPFYVPHFKKLSMYSEWRQQDTKTDKLFVGAYDSRQRRARYTTAGKAKADLMVHSSYKFVAAEASGQSGDKSEDVKSNSSIMGGYECNDDYTYVRGRGRGRYVCDQCGIRCKKPSMLKKHIRTHSNDRPYTCNHCNFSFKTKGNLTKHMKSKAHTKNYTASGSGSSTQQSGTQSSESDTEDSGMDSSDESTRREEHEAAYGLLSLAQKTSTSHPPLSPSSHPPPLDSEEIAHISKAVYVKNKMLDCEYGHSPPLPSAAPTSPHHHSDDGSFKRFGHTRPLTYPYTSSGGMKEVPEKEGEEGPKNIRQFHVIQKYAPKEQAQQLSVQVSVVRKTPVEEDVRKRKLSYEGESERSKQPKPDEVIDLSMPVNGAPVAKSNGYVNVNYVVQDGGRPTNGECNRYDNSAMETLADIATKQVKLEKNTLAKSVASEFLKIATKHESGEVCREPIGRTNQEVNEIIGRGEGNKSCHICAKSFSKAPQLRLHMNIHYLERPFRCHSCSVSFRTKGHLQKHERSASHHNKLSSSPALSSSEPRPFKCVDCNIAFRIHGHLAKHLRSKMHIMKLECLSKIPFGLYAELERSNSLLTEINTADGDQCLESLKTLAQKVFKNDPNKLNQLSSAEHVDPGS